MESENKILSAIINGYRKVIFERYQYDAIQSKYELPETFDEERMTRFRNYFLEYIYPENKKRKELNESFDSLHNFIRYPEKLLRILFDSRKLVFKYGRHLPKILNTGLKAWKSFSMANDFENKLVQAAISNQLDPPYTPKKIETLIKSLSRKDIENFIKSGESLFKTIHDRTLVKKIREINEQIILNMKKKPKIYTPADIRGLEIGQEVITKGDQLFEELDKEDQEMIFDFVIAVERDALDEIYSSKN